jgi:hypothetical protein
VPSHRGPLFFGSSFTKAFFAVVLRFAIIASRRIQNLDTSPIELASIKTLSSFLT